MSNTPEQSWKNTNINVDSLWLIPKRDSSGKHSNSYHGNFVPQIPYQLISRYTQENNYILELFSGSGTTAFECENLNRNYIGFDINDEIINEVNRKMYNTHISYNTVNCDVTNPELFDLRIKNILNIHQQTSVDFLIAHPPYMDIIRFTEKDEDLSHISDINTFINKLISAMENGLNFLKKNRYFAIVMGDIYKNSEVIPLGFYTMNAIKLHFNVKLKGIIVKNIEGNRGKLGVNNIWKYRAIHSDYFLFKHEYIFVFKKIS
ncbi:MAG: site-specific DNA-methyltransferase [Clostridia bacterium]|nr:site-specific DNA-methyltransferase [Clostridia bacterium]MCI9085025.1 site-specific DNA-methyltransferase [Clostridia bacterium]